MYSAPCSRHARCPSAGTPDLTRSSPKEPGSGVQSVPSTGRGRPIGAALAGRGDGGGRRGDLSRLPWATGAGEGDAGRARASREAGMHQHRLDDSRPGTDGSRSSGTRFGPVGPAAELLWQRHSSRTHPLIRAIHVRRPRADRLPTGCAGDDTRRSASSHELGGGAALSRAPCSSNRRSGRSPGRARPGWSRPSSSARRRTRADPGGNSCNRLRGRGWRYRGWQLWLELVRREIAPTVALYVNDWNVPAGGPNERVAFRKRRFST